jgi:thiamine-phosphate pyrophosphorylase
MVQLREKDSISDHDFINLSKLLLRTLESFRVPLIINDRVDICHIVGAHGVHLGQNDMHPDEARKILGKPAIIGLSLECPKHLDQANMLDSIDYVAASHIFESKAKQNQLKQIQNLPSSGVSMELKSFMAYQDIQLYQLEVLT